MGVLKTAVDADNFNVAGHWSPAGIPADTDTINLATYTTTIPSGYTTNKVIAIDGGGAGAKLVVADGGKLNFEGGFATFDSGEELEIEQDGEIELVCASDNLDNRIIMNTGSILKTHGVSGNMAYIHGTDATHRPTYGLHIQGELDESSVINGLHLKWTYSVGLWIYTSFVAPPLIKDIHIEDFFDQGIQIRALYGATMRNVAIHGGRTGINVRECLLVIDNLTLGEDLAGTPDTHSLRDLQLSAQAQVRIDNGRLLSTTPVLLSKHDNIVAVRNNGYIAGDGILTERGTIGTDKVWAYQGTIEESAGEVLITPNSNCSSVRPLTYGIHKHAPFFPRVPVSGGDTIALSVVVELNGSQPADSVVLEIDPSDLYDANDQSTEPTPQSTETTLTAQGTVKAGSFNGKLPWQVRVDDYAAGGTVKIKSVTVTPS